MAATLRSIFKHGTSLVKRGTLRLWSRSKDVILMNWHLGFTAFGGPTVHYQIVRAHDRIQHDERARLTLPSSMNDSWKSTNGSMSNLWVTKSLLRSNPHFRLIAALLVSRNIRNKPGASRPRKYEDALLHQL